MSEIIAIGDTHGRALWKDVVEKHKNADKIVLIGDYFDTHDDISPELQMINFREICQYKEAHKEQIVLLIGNHDEHYFPFMGNSGTSGFNAGAAPAIGHLLMTYKDLLQMAHYEDNILFTHAGVGETWFNANIPEIKEEWSARYISDSVNDVWKYKPFSFKFNGWRDSSGDEIGQTPIWIRPRALLQDTKNMRKAGIIQIVGHTQVTKIDVEGSKKNTGGKLFMIDALGTSKEYLIIENGEFKIGKI